MKDINLCIQKTELQTEFNSKEIHIKASTIAKRQRENLENIKREETHHVQGSINKIGSRFPIRNHGGHEGVE